MTEREAIKARHSVRAYTKRPIDGEVLETIEQEIRSINERSGLRITLCRNEPKAMTGLLAHYGAFENAENYFALIGPDTDDLFVRCGYWGERLVLLAETLGLNTCWVAGSYKKAKVRTLLRDGERLAAIITVGYGAKPGTPHCSKTYEQVTKTSGPVPEWFRAGVEAALLAPTAINQQKFRIDLRDGEPSVKALMGPFAKIDAGIVQYHFEIGSGRTIPIE